MGADFATDPKRNQIIQDAVYSIHKYRKCPIWTLVNKLEGGGPKSDRCGPKCHLFDEGHADCIFIVIGGLLSEIVEGRQA